MLQNTAGCLKAWLRGLGAVQAVLPELVLRQSMDELASRQHESSRCILIKEKGVVTRSMGLRKRKLGSRGDAADISPCSEVKTLKSTALAAFDEFLFVESKRRKVKPDRSAKRMIEDQQLCLTQKSQLPAPSSKNDKPTVKIGRQRRNSGKNLDKAFGHTDLIQGGPGPTPVLQCGTSIGELLPQTWYKRDSLEVAPDLIGKLLRRDDVVLRITEVEAYRPGDTACHARFGCTQRTAPLFGPAGHAYVYLCYGLHSMLNVVTNEVGVGAAVLIRACEPVQGLATIQQRRRTDSVKPVLLTGPGKIGEALGLTTGWSNHPLFEPGGLELLDAPPPPSILIGPRVGINYADPNDVSANWRFACGDTPWVTQRKFLVSP